MPNLQQSPAGVPVFTCIVYVAAVDGGIQARVANLAGITETGASEREALGKVIGQFKQRLADYVARQEPVPWIDPPDTAAPSEQQRLVPVHL